MLNLHVIGEAHTQHGVDPANVEVLPFDTIVEVDHDKEDGELTRDELCAKALGVLLNHTHSTVAYIDSIAVV